MAGTIIHPKENILSKNTVKTFDLGNNRTN